MALAILEAVLGNLAVAAVLASAAFAIGRWANRPALAHALWLLVLLKLLTPALLTIPVRCLPVRAVPSNPAPVVRALPESAADHPPISGIELPPQAPVLPADRAFVPSIDDNVETQKPTAIANLSVDGQSANGTPSWEDSLLGVWAIGTLISLGVALRRVRRFTRLLAFASPAPAELLDSVAAAAGRIGLRRVPRVRIVPGGIAPMLWAMGRPVLYFPAGLLARLSPEQQVTLVEHELAHLRRRDHFVRLLELAALAAYWWCPLVWLARSELRRVEEEACDLEVVAAAPGSGYAYASAILETIDYLAGVAPAPALASRIGDGASLRRRLELILANRHPRPAGRAHRGIALAGLALLVFGPRLDRPNSEAIGAELEETDQLARSNSMISMPADETVSDSIHFLPTPAQLISTSDLGAAPSLASALSTDGTRCAMAVGSTVIVWDLRSKRRVFTLSGHTDIVNAVVFSPDGRRLATASNDTTAILWDAADGRRLHTLSGQGRWVLSAAFSPDGRTLAMGGYDRTVRLWDVAAGVQKTEWHGHAGGVRSVAFSPDGRTIATGGADHSIRLWDVKRGVVKQILKGHEAAVRAVAFSSDGSRLAGGSEDRTVRLWDAADGREVGSPVPLPDYVTALAFAARGQALYAGTFGGHLIHINPISGQLRGYIGVEPGRAAGSPAHASSVTAILIPTDGKSMYTVSQDRVALAWRAVGPPQTPRLAFRGARPMTAVALSPDGRMLATGGQDGLIRLWDAGTARELMTLPGHPGCVSTMVFGASGRLVSAGADEQVRVWDTATGRATYAVIQPTADLRIALSPDGRVLAIGGRKLPGVRLVNMAAPGKTRRFAEFAGEVTALAFAPTGDRIATGYADGMIRFWDAATEEELARGKAGHGSVDGISFSPAGPGAAIVVNATAGVDGETEYGPSHQVVFLDIRDGSILDSPRPLAHASPLTAAAYTPDGRLLTAAHDGNLYLWNLGGGQVERIIRGHVDAVRGVALTSDGASVFSAGDRAAKRWPLRNEPADQRNGLESDRP
jgi:WD40 repeat protein/beta-lactamase regulating signal transducer with metallopeptidase domain